MAALIAGLQTWRFCEKICTVLSTSQSKSFNNPRRSKYYIVLPNVPTDTPETNPLMRIEGIPDFQGLTRDNCINAVAKFNIELDMGIGKLEERLGSGSEEKSFSNIISTLDKLSVPVNFALSTIYALSFVDSSLRLNEAVSKLFSLVQKTRERKYSLPIYNTLKELDANRKGLNSVQQYVLDNILFESKISGITLPEEKKDIYDSTILKIKNYKFIFRERSKTATSKFSVEFTDDKMVENFPSQLKNYMAKDKSRPNQGPWILTVHQPVYGLFMEHCSDRMHRWHAWRGNVSRASDKHGNAIIIEEIRSSRHTMAAQLGFSSYAEFSLQTKMAGSISNVKDMLKTLHVQSKPVIEEELLKLQDFALKNDFNGQLELWDIPFWRRVQKTETFNLDEFEVGQYFQLDTVLNSIFGMCKRLFGISIRAKRTDHKFWNEDVQYYEVYNEKDQFIGSFCLDPYLRFGQKYPQDLFVPIRSRCAAVNVEPLSYIVLNCHRPVAGQSAFLQFKDVYSLLEKFGYLLQHTVSEVPYNDLAGLNIREQDMSPAVSKFMCHLLFHYETCVPLTQHATTKEPISRELHKKLVQSHLHMAAYDLTNEVYLSTLDLELHSKRDHLWSITKKLWAEFIPFNLDKVDSHPCTFHEIFSGELGAAYYSLKWSEMIAADMFSAFLEVGLDKEDEINTLGKRFRDTVLAVGGGCPATETFRRFRGRDPSIEALLVYYGIKKSK